MWLQNILVLWLGCILGVVSPEPCILVTWEVLYLLYNFKFIIIVIHLSILYNNKFALLWGEAQLCLPKKIAYRYLKVT